MSTQPAAIARVLIRNLESDASPLEFSHFSITSLADLEWRAVREYFPNASRDEWLLKRDYATIPPASEAWSGFGAIPSDVEDTLLRDL
jgi:hypothetical protein